MKHRLRWADLIRLAGPILLVNDQRPSWLIQSSFDAAGDVKGISAVTCEGTRLRTRAACASSADEFTRRMTRQQAAIAAIDSGYLRRELFVARTGAVAI
jgi:hypothetical protein